jgi:hypothetical protein
LLAKRKELWEKQQKEGNPPDLIIQGCEDHVFSLMSKDYETWLVNKSAPHLIMKSKHRATDVVQFIIAKVIFLSSKKEKG